MIQSPTRHETHPRIHIKIHRQPVTLGELQGTRCPSVPPPMEEEVREGNGDRASANHDG